MLPAMTLPATAIDGDAWRDLRCAPRPDVVVTDLGDQLVLLDPRNQEMYALDAVGRFVWGALPGATLFAAATALAERYAIDADTAAGDVRDLVRELADAGVVHLAADGEPPA